MIRLLLYLVAAAVIFGAGFAVGRSYTGRSSKVNSYLKGMRSDRDHGNDA